MNGNKIDNLLYLKKGGFKIPNFIYFREGEKNIDFCKIKKKLNFPLIVRSSHDLEDSRYSFSGVFKSFFPIYTEKDFYIKIKQILDYKDNYLFNQYVKINKIKNIGNYKMNVLIQEFINGDYSGICNFSKSKLLIEVELVPGLNFPLVSGKYNYSFKFDTNFKSLDYNIKSLFLEDKYFILNNNVIVENSVDYSFDYEGEFIKKYLKILLVEMISLYKFSKKEDFLVEFTVKNGIFYILQLK